MDFEIENIFSTEISQRINDEDVCLLMEVLFHREKVRPWIGKIYTTRETDTKPHYPLGFGCIIYQIINIPRSAASCVMGHAR